MAVKKSDYENEISYYQKQYIHPEATHFVYSKQNYSTLCLHKNKEMLYHGIHHIRDKFSIFEYIVDVTKGNFYAILLDDLEDDIAIDASDKKAGVMQLPANTSNTQKSNVNQESWNDHLGFTMTNVGVQDTENNISNEQIIDSLQDDYLMLRDFIVTAYGDYTELQGIVDLSNDNKEALDFIKALYVLVKRKDLIGTILDEAPF
jgi:hypothetical protein